MKIIHRLISTCLKKKQRKIMSVQKNDPNLKHGYNYHHMFKAMRFIWNS